MFLDTCIQIFQITNMVSMVCRYLLLEVGLALLKLDEFCVEVLHCTLALSQACLELQLRVLQLLDLGNTILLVLKEHEK